MMPPAFSLAVLEVWGSLFLCRVRREEALMLETYGDSYRHYMQRVGGIWPRR